MAGIGPDSFAIGGDGNVVLQQSNVSGAGPATQLAGSTGGGVSAGQVSFAPGGEYGAAAAQSMKTIDALNKLTDGLLRPQIEAEQKRMYFDGMSKVAQGQALLDIEKEQPWYSKIFGPSATVQGAQAMAATTALTQAHTDFLRQMPELRERSPDEVRKYLVEQAANIGATGDPLVDSMVQAKLGEAWGPMLQTHMKEHIVWQQEDMLKKQFNMNVANGENLKFSRLANSKTGWADEDKMRQYNDTVEAARPAYGQSKDSWGKGQIEAIRANLTAGNFDYFNAIRGSDLWTQLDPGARTQLEEQVPMYMQKDALTNPATMKIMTDQSGLEFNLTHGTSGLTHEGLDKVIDSFNARNSKDTGAHEDMMNNHVRAHYHKLLEQGSLAMQKQLAAAQAKQDNYNAAATVVAKAFNSGDIASIKGLEIPELAAKDFMDASFASEVGSNDPKRMQVWFDKAAQSASEGKLRSPQLEGIFQTQLGPLITGNGPATPSMQQALQMASMLYHSPAGGAGALAHYMGDSAPKVVALLQSGADINDPQQLQQAREVIARGSNAVAGKEEVDAAKNYMAKADPSFWSRLAPWNGRGELTPFNLNAGNKQALIDLTAPQIAQYSKAYNMLPQDAAPLVMANVLRNADFLPGAFVQHNPTVRGDASFSGAVNRLAPGVGNQSTSLYQSAMRSFINEKLTASVKAAGGDMSNFKPDEYEIRSGEQLGDGKLLLFLSNPKQAGIKMLRIDAGRSADDKDGFVYHLLNTKTSEARAPIERAEAKKKSLISAVPPGMGFTGMSLPPTN